MTHKHRLGTAGYYVVSIVLAVIALIPFMWMISTSLKSRGALMSIPIEWIPAEPTLDGYAKVFSRFPFLRTIGNSLLIPSPTQSSRSSPPPWRPSPLQSCASAAAARYSACTRDDDVSTR